MDPLFQIRSFLIYIVNLQKEIWIPFGICLAPQRGTSWCSDAYKYVGLCGKSVTYIYVYIQVCFDLFVFSHISCTSEGHEVLLRHVPVRRSKL